MRGGILAAAAAFFVFPLTASAQSPARTGEAERAGGPLRVVSESAAAVFMVAGTRPTARPAKPVDAWFWTFHRTEQSAGSHRYDILVTRERMDCAAGTAQILGVEAYRDGSLVVADKAGRPARPQQPGTSGHAKLSSVCDLDFRTDAPSYADHRVARAAVPVGSVASAPKPALPKAVPPPPAAAKAPAASAQKGVKLSQAESTDGPLRWVSGTGVIHMVTGSAPVQRPSAPVDVWFWSFFPAPEKMGPITYDTVAMRMIVDCAAGTVSNWGIDSFLNDRLINESYRGSKPVPAQKPVPDSGQHTQLRAVCEPGFAGDTQSFPDFRSARAAALKFFAERSGAPETARAPAQSGPTPVTASEKAAAKAPATGDAERARGELRVIGFTPELVTMVAGSRPTKDTRTAEIWLWTFLPAERSGGGEPYDASASRLRIDCAAGTTNAWGQAENYRNGQLVQSLKSSGWPPRKEPPGSLGHLAIRASCEPDFASKLTALPDQHAAREASWKHFAQHGKTTPAAKAPAPPASPARSPSTLLPAALANLPTGRAEQAGGPLTILTFTNDRISLVSGQRPSARPSAPVFVWLWDFYREESKFLGTQFDTTAARWIVNCAESTIQNRALDHYHGGRPVRETPTPGKAQTPQPGTIAQLMIRTVCEPGFNPKADSFADHSAARDAATKFFARQAAATPAAKAPAPSGPTPVTAAEKAAASAKAAPAAKSSPPAPVAQPKGGYAATLPGPVRMYSAAPGTIQAIVGAKPERRPSKPVEVWIWIFNHEIRDTGRERFDSMAARYRIDCEGGTSQLLLTEPYLGDTAHAPVKGTAAPSAPKPGTAGQEQLRAACDPQFNPKAPTFPDHRAARAAATKFFASQKKK